MKIILFGEAMLELSHLPSGGVTLSYGGDVLNSTVYMARLGLNPFFVSALGTDPYSSGLLSDWERECIQTKYVLKDSERMPGLYAIQTDHRGERSFFYWRKNSAARNFFNLLNSQDVMKSCESADLLFVSGITLSIYNDDNRKKIIELAKIVRQNGGLVLFDPNYRPAGWESNNEAAKSMRAFAKHVSIMLATIDDENLLFGQLPGHEHVANWHDIGVETVILKCGPRGAIIYEKGKDTPQDIPVDTQDNPIDTTGAGDAFNGAFMAAMSRGLSLRQAAILGNALASQVIMHPGAIIPVAAMPNLNLTEV
ncbi:MAG: sugar kinase [Litorimonas sp.]